MIFQIFPKDNRPGNFSEAVFCFLHSLLLSRDYFLGVFGKNTFAVQKHFSQRGISQVLGNSLLKRNAQEDSLLAFENHF